jgi:aminoglycoside phosphotransferase (APT) family kinase protein
MRRRPVDVPGWDSDAVVVDERYIERIPRRRTVRRGLEQECRVLPVIAPLLPLAVPVPTEMAPDGFGPWRVRHEMLPGAAAEPATLTDADGAKVGAFLRTLHDLPLADLGLNVSPDHGFAATVERMAREVLPLLGYDDRRAGAALLHRVTREAPRVFAHRDLGPDHLLVAEGRVTGVIDWTDAGLDDPAIDLAWVVHGTPARFRDGLLRVYGPRPDELERSLDWHRMGPWHEVLWGLDGGEGGAAHVTSGLAGVHRRLRETRSGVCL